MGFRFQKRIKILPGITLNLSRSGLSTSLGTKGARVTLGHGQQRTSVGIPGSGLSHTTVTTGPRAAHTRSGSVGIIVAIGIALIIGALGAPIVIAFSVGLAAYLVAHVIAGHADAKTFTPTPAGTPENHAGEGRYRIRYHAADGAETTRDIDIQRVMKHNGTTLLQAHCHLRNAERSFDQARILTCTDLDTGNIVSDPGREAIENYTARHHPPPPAP